jgi:hypothetical protein
LSTEIVSAMHVAQVSERANRLWTSGGGSDKRATRHVQRVEKLGAWPKLSTRQTANIYVDRPFHLDESMSRQ